MSRAMSTRSVIHCTQPTKALINCMTAHSDHPLCLKPRNCLFSRSLHCSMYMYLLCIIIYIKKEGGHISSNTTSQSDQHLCCLLSSKHLTRRDKYLLIKEKKHYDCNFIKY